MIRASWDPPQNAAACVGKYMLQVWDQDNSNLKEYETNETFYELSSIVGCMQYNVQVKPWVNQSMEGNVEVKTVTVGDLRKLRVCWKKKFNSKEKNYCSHKCTYDSNDWYHN